jgi:class 3 adenylate cyclase
MFRHSGPRTRRLVAFLKRRAKGAAGTRPSLDCSNFPALFRKRAVVFTDTADFTIRTARDGILHFLMLFDRIVDETRPAIRRSRGEIVKVEGDSMLLRFPDVAAACAGVAAIEAVLRRGNRARPENESMRFSYGIGFGDILDIEGDLFGLEVNLASKLGEDQAQPGEALLTPGAHAALAGTWRRRVVPYGTVRIGTVSVDVNRLRLGRLA